MDENSLTIVAHSHTIDGYSNTILGHSHTMDGYSHTIDGHRHTIVGHTHTIDGQSHSILQGTVIQQMDKVIQQKNTVIQQQDRVIQTHISQKIKKQSKSGLELPKPKCLFESLTVWHLFYALQLFGPLHPTRLISSCPVSSVTRWLDYS